VELLGGGTYMNSGPKIRKSNKGTGIRNFNVGKNSRVIPFFPLDSSLSFNAQIQFLDHRGVTKT
jgi:hypothetical protein